MWTKFWFWHGQIVDIDEDETDGSVLYRVTYEGGISEDLNEIECRTVIDLFQENKQWCGKWVDK